MMSLGSDNPSNVSTNGKSGLLLHYGTSSGEAPRGTSIDGPHSHFFALAQAATRQLSEAIKRFIVSYDNVEDEDMEWRPSPLQPLPDSRGIDHQQRVEFLRLLKDGLGRTMAASQLGISSTTLKRTMAKSPAFREAVEQVEQARADNLFTGLYVAALRGNTRAAMFLLSREKR